MWLSCWSVLSQGTCLAGGFISLSECLWEATSEWFSLTSVFPSLSISLPISLRINKYNLLKTYKIKLCKFQVYNSTIHFSVHCSVCSPSKSSLLPSPFIPTQPSSTSPHPLSLCPSGNHHTVAWVYVLGFLFFLNPSHFLLSPTTSLLSDSCQSVLYEWICLYFICKFILFIRSSTHEWNYMIFSLTGLFHLV